MAMIESLGSMVFVSINTWILFYASDLVDPTFFIWMDGQLIGSTKNTSHEVYVPNGEAPVFSVFDSAADIPSNIFPAKVKLLWNRSTGAAVDVYKVEEDVGGFIERALIKDDGRPQYYFLTRALEDVTVHAFRVTAIGVNGNSETPVNFGIFMVRNPDPPDVAYAYNNVTDIITVSAV